MLGKQYMTNPVCDMLFHVYGVWCVVFLLGDLYGMEREDEML